MQGYIVEYGFIPDDDYVNTVPTPEYFGYYLGANDSKTLSMWVIEPRVAVPTVTVEDLLPDDYEEVTIDSELSSFGIVREFQPQMIIADAVQFIQDQIDSFPE